MRQKLGLLELVDEENDAALVEELLKVWPPFGPCPVTACRWKIVEKMPITRTHSRAVLST